MSLEIFVEGGRAVLGGLGGNAVAIDEEPLRSEGSIVILAIPAVLLSLTRIHYHATINAAKLTPGAGLTDGSCLSRFYRAMGREVAIATPRTNTTRHDTTIRLAVFFSAKEAQVFELVF